MISAALLACTACHHAHDQAPHLLVEIRAELLGTSADELATRVTTPLERELVTMPHIVTLESSTTAGDTRLRLTLDGNDAFAAVDAVRAVVTRVAPRLPSQMMPPLDSRAGCAGGALPRPARGCGQRGGPARANAGRDSRRALR